MGELPSLWPAGQREPREILRIGHRGWVGASAPSEPHLQLVEGDWLGKVRAEGLGVICWHEERRRVVEGLWELGVDGVCTDDPPLLTRVAVDRSRR